MLSTLCALTSNGSDSYAIGDTTCFDDKAGQMHEIHITGLWDLREQYQLKTLLAQRLLVIESSMSWWVICQVSELGVPKFSIKTWRLKAEGL